MWVQRASDLTSSSAVPSAWVGLQNVGQGSHWALARHLALHRGLASSISFYPSPLCCVLGFVFFDGKKSPFI